MSAEYLTQAWWGSGYGPVEIQILENSFALRPAAAHQAARRITNFKTDLPYRIVTLEETCKRQQVGEGWFWTLSELPEKVSSLPSGEAPLTASSYPNILDGRFGSRRFGSRRFGSAPGSSHCVEIRSLR